MLPSSLALLLPEFEDDDRSRAIGIWAAVGGLAAAAGPPVGGRLVEISWRLVFLVNIPIGLATIICAVRVLNESRDHGQERPDVPGSVLIAVAIGALALALVKAPDWGWDDARTLASSGVAAIGLIAFWARCLTHPSPVIDPGLLRVRSFALSLLANVLFATGCAVYTMTRQDGFVLGVSVLVAILGTPGRSELAAFHRGRTFMLIAAGLATVTALFIGEARHTAALSAEPLAAASPGLPCAGALRAARCVDDS